MYNPIKYARAMNEAERAFNETVRHAENFNRSADRRMADKLEIALKKVQLERDIHNRDYETRLHNACQRRHNMEIDALVNYGNVEEPPEDVGNVDWMKE